MLERPNLDGNYLSRFGAQQRGFELISQTYNKYALKQLTLSSKHDNLISILQ